MLAQGGDHEMWDLPHVQYYCPLFTEDILTYWLLLGKAEIPLVF